MKNVFIVNGDLIFVEIVFIGVGIVFISRIVVD